MKYKNCFAAAVLSMAVGGWVFAQDPVPAAPASPSTDSVSLPAQSPGDEIAALRSRLDQLEAKQREAAAKVEEKKTTEQVILDANKRSQMLDVGDFTAGHKDGRFFIGSEDGRFNLRPWFHLQVRDITVERQTYKGGGFDDIQNGFEIRRMRFGFDGNAFTPDLTYFFNWATVRASGTSNVNNTATPAAKIGTVSNNLGGVPLLEEAWVKYRINGGDFYIKGGQLKAPLMHDQIVSSRYQQSAERSLMADIFANGDNFSEAVTLIYDPHTNIRAEAGVTHGERSANTNFLDYPNTNAYNYGGIARVEYKVMGDWKDYSQVGGLGVKDSLLVVGLGAAYDERGHANQVVGALDVSYADPHGFNAYGAFLDRYTDHNFGLYSQSAVGASINAPPASVLNTPTNEYGLLAQAGYLFGGQHWEPFGRYEYFHLRGNVAGSKGAFSALTGGVNYYLFGHGAKLTAQVTYLPNGIPLDDTPNDVLAQPTGHSEFSGSVQFQLSI